MTIGEPIGRAGVLAGGYARSSLRSLSLSNDAAAGREKKTASRLRPASQSRALRPRQGVSPGLFWIPGGRHSGRYLGRYLLAIAPVKSVFSLCAPALAIDPLPRPSLLTSHFDLTLFGFFWPVYIFATLTVQSKFPPTQKKTSSCPPNATRLASSGPGDLLLHPLRLPSLPFPFAPPSDPDLLASNHRRLGTLRTQHTPPSRITRLVHITSHVFVQRL